MNKLFICCGILVLPFFVNANDTQKVKSNVEIVDSPKNTTESSSVAIVNPPKNATELNSRIYNGCKGTRYATTENINSVIGYYNKELKENGWKILSEGGGGGNYGAGGGLTAQKESTYIKVGVGGYGGNNYIKVVTGPDRHTIDDFHMNS